MTGLVSSFAFDMVAPPLSMTVVPGTLTSYHILPYGSESIREVITPSGGTPPYTYLATYVSGDTSIVVSDETTNSVLFDATGDGTPINSQEVVYDFTVTDAALAEVTERCTIGFVFGLNPP